MPAGLARAIIFGLALTMSLPVLSQESGEVHHTISFPDLKQQYVHVRSEFPVGGIAATIRMANWTPGSYLIRDYAADVDRISFQGETGESLDFIKTSKSSWQVMLEGNTRLVVEYDVHAGVLSVQTSWVSPEYVLINGASVLLYSDVTRDLPHRLTVSAPSAFDTVNSPLPKTGDSNAFLATGFDELVDSPVVISGAMEHYFVEGAQEYALVNVAAGELWDHRQSVQDLRRVVKATNELWGTMPFEQRYWFFNFLVERGGGLEHDHSTVIMGSRWQMLEREDYIKWLSLAAHEYFHSWNVRRMRPEGLASYNYQDEQYSGALWLAEGITSYYDNLLLSRAGLVAPDEYFKRLAVDLHALELTPGRKLISLEQASRDSWIRHYKQDANSLNSTISYYTKGAVLGLVLDTQIRKASNYKSSLDDVMRLMFQRWGTTPYPETAFADAVQEIAGVEIRQWLEPLLNTAAELDIDQALAWYGLSLNRHPVNNAARTANKPLVSGIGVNWDTDQAGLVILNVVDATSASEAGLLPDDELLAINDERVTSDNYDDRMTRLQPGMDVRLTISRRGRLMTVRLTLQEARSATYEIQLDPEFGKNELNRLESWLGQPLQSETN